ncbi:MAG: RecQ family ATP-dependent DNA helicase, partial [Cyanobacteria bacterium P01_G01_bin.38]
MSQQHVEEALQRIWGYDRFRSPQGEIIQALLAGQDALIVMPTGGGKSICFQLPALLQRGVTLIVSPLVALIENQVQELKLRGLSAALLHSAVPDHERRRTLMAVTQNRLRLLYLSPETLLSPKVWETLCQPQIQINGLVLDEAHCLVQWGDTFRPAYRRLGAVRAALLKSKPAGTRIAIAAFTATANPDAQATLQTALGLKNPEIVRLNPYRDNLHLSVKTVWTPRGRKRALLKFIQAHHDQSGIVYARTRRETEDLANWLRVEGYQTLAYHGGLVAGQRRLIEQEWLTNQCQFVVCTSAFGMGINKPDVRWVIHFQAPSTLSEYVQEVGRGGRDGKPANALTLVSEPTGWLDPQDQQRWKFFADNSAQLQQEARRLVRKLPKEGSVMEVAKQDKKGAIALSLLHSTGQLIWLDPFQYRLTPKAKQSKSNFFDAIKDMKGYLHGKRCRWQMLLTQFG